MALAYAHTRLEERRRIEDERKRYEDHFPGWHGNDSVPRCPRVVAGKRCQVGYPSGRWSGCICQRNAGTGLLDHARMWRTPENERVLTGEPYQIDAEELRLFTQECAALGLKIELSDYSPYNPGATSLILIRK